MALPQQIITVPGAFAFHKPGADLGNFKQRVNDRKIHMREAELFFKEGIPPSPGQRNPDGIDPSLLEVRHSLTETAIQVLRLAAMRSRNGKLSLAKEETPLPCALSGKQCFDRGVCRRCNSPMCLFTFIPLFFYIQVICSNMQ